MPRAIRLLGYTSFIATAVHEAVYPLLPMFVTRVLGGSVVALAVIDGATRATSVLVDAVAGRASARARRRKARIIAGTAVSGVATALLAGTSTWQHVLILRLAERLGWGMDSVPRAALLQQIGNERTDPVSTPVHRRAVVAGRIAGPLAATLFLWRFPGQYRALFATTFVLSIAAVVGLRWLSAPSSRNLACAAQSDGSPDDTVREAPKATTFGGAGAVLLALAEVSDIFLLFRLSEAGVLSMHLPLLWAARQAISVSLSPSPITGPRRRGGERRFRAVAWAAVAMAYIWFAVADTVGPLVAGYAIHSVARSLANPGAPPADAVDLQGSALAPPPVVVAGCALAGSVLFALIWETLRPAVALFTAAGVMLMGAAVLAADRSASSPS